ncbi:MAG TPA: hypothetical protein VGN13_12470 [Solirubrobacteraceae bacterium]|jgi:hypothetical protein
MPAQGGVAPAIPPQPPQLSLLNSAVKPPDTIDADGLNSEDRSNLPQELRDELEARQGDAWTRGFTYAPESHEAIAVHDPCDGTAIDLPALPAPLNLAAVASAGGGTVKAEALEYQVTAKNANGETTALTAVKVTPGAEGTVKLTWSKVSETAQYNIYGRAAGVLKLITTVGPFDDNQEAAFVDDGSKAPKSASPPVANTTGGPGPYGNPPIVAVVPYLLVAEDSCSSFGFEERDFKGRATRLIENAKHAAIEKEFWGGALAQAKGYPNDYLTREANLTNLTPGTVPSIARGFEILQEALASCGFGGQGMIHTQTQAVPNLLNVRRVGNLMLDMFDNIVVPGVGYPGTGPGGSTPSSGKAFMYATDLVMVREESEPTIIADTFAESFDWGQAGSPNTIRFRAEKFVAAYADMVCKFVCEVKTAE